jgi:hypothetical protein
VSLFAPAALTARYRQPWSGDVAVLSPGAVPTVDFYLTPRLAELAPERVRQFDSRALDAAAQSLPVGALVIIVRHAARRWLRFLAEQADRWCGVAWLVDDDIPAAWRCQELPLGYRLRTSGRFLWVERDLLSVCDRVWASTEALQQRYAQWKPVVVPPLYPFQARSAAPAGVRRWCYHGTRAHRAEMNWLKPVVAAVQRRVPDAEFEIMGGVGVRRLLAGIPRVHVLPPRSWRDYVEHCRNSQIAVGLAPLLPGSFNAARAHVKLFDITHAGAVGVYSRRAPYFPTLATAGVVFADDDQAVWSEQIVALLLDDARRLSLFSRAMDWSDTTPPQPGMRELINCP